MRRTLSVGVKFACVRAPPLLEDRDADGVEEPKHVRSDWRRPALAAIFDFIQAEALTEPTEDRDVGSTARV